MSRYACRRTWPNAARGLCAAHRSDPRYAASASTSASVSSNAGMCALGRCMAGSRSQRVKYTRSYLRPTVERSGPIGVPNFPITWQP
jgi:hypothetical protein